MRSAKGRDRSANSSSPCVPASSRSALWRLWQRFKKAAVSSGLPKVMVGVETSRPSREMSWSSPRTCDSDACGLRPRRQLRRPARREQLHLPPMMLHAFPPLMQILVAVGGQAILEALAGRAIAAPQAFGERAESRRDRRRDRRKPDEARAGRAWHRRLRSAPGSAPPHAAASRAKRARSGSALGRVPSRSRGRACRRRRSRHGRRGPGQAPWRWRRACRSDWRRPAPASRVERGEGASGAVSGICGRCGRRFGGRGRRERAMGDIELGEGHAAQRLAHRNRRIET